MVSMLKLVVGLVLLMLFWVAFREWKRFQRRNKGKVKLEDELETLKTKEEEVELLKEIADKKTIIKKQEEELQEEKK